MNALMPSLVPSGQRIAAGTTIHRGLLALIGVPPEVVQRFDATYRHGYGPVDVDVYIMRPPISMIGIQSVRCAADLAGRMCNAQWIGLSNSDLAKSVLAEIQSRRSAEERGVLRSATVMDRMAFHLGIAALGQTLSVLSLARAGLLHPLPDILTTIMVIYSCAAIIRDQGVINRALADKAQRAAIDSVRLWKDAWITSSITRTDVTSAESFSAVQSGQ